MTFSIDNIVLIGSFLLFLSIFAGKTGYRFGVPTLVLFLGVGMLFGSDGIGLEFSNSATAQFIGVVALNIILFSGGMDTQFSDTKPILWQGLVLATLGVFLTAMISGVFIYWLTENFFSAIAFSLSEALLLGAIMSSTDSASVFAILGAKGLNLKHRLRPLLEFESGSNDPMAYLLTITIIQIIQTGTGSPLQVVTNFFFQLILGALAGYFFGRLAVKIINHTHLNHEALYPVLLLAMVFIIFSVTNEFNGNGYLAAYISGLVVGNSKFIHKKTTKSFFDGMAWLFQIIMFLTLGLLVNPSELMPVAGIGLVISLFLIFIARPIAVWLCLIPFKSLPTKAKHYVSWVGLRGAVPIIFATYPLTMGISHAQMIFNIVFFVTLVSLLVQGTTVSLVAYKLGLAKSNESLDNAIPVDPLPENIKSTISEITIEPQQLVNGCKIVDMPIPDNTVIVMVKRKGKYFVPTGATEIEPKDILLLISDNETSLREAYIQMNINNA